ncbi:GTP cyclohydrolase I FolE [Actinomyces sp. zg-332]|uniref:GTP cyclohydrolase I FolE n=1 Tax=Actinomyces sp. zg-332 TaxID=2708340 RepID=UPI00141FD40C|nr:GTP cyclohydrolase I FolE [Actinomyces sp. zg-332]QPK94050.1 GTP cyclohydrolase I FolE [Actinomyces sp. zg-332]
MTYNYDGVKKAVRDLLIAVGEDPDRDGLLETPDRVARSFQELLSGMDECPPEHLKKQFKVDHDELVIVKDISFFSCCEHHMLPFYGVAHVCYIPSNGKVTGLSKLARLVEGYARRLQVQERITGQIADAITEQLHAEGVLVVLEAEHMCMSMRGIKKPGSKTITLASRGNLSDSVKQNEIMRLLSIDK